MHLCDKLVAMDKFVVAAVQMRMRMPATLDEYRYDLRRFVRSAEGKRARLVVFPELAGVMIAPALLRDVRTNLLRQAEQGKRRNAKSWDKIRGGAAGWLAGMLKADLRTATAGLLEINPGELWQTYCEIFGDLARAHGITIVAPSAYLPDPESGAIVNQSAVFGPNGDLLGQQSKVLGYVDDADIAQRGRVWEVIPTEVGRVGIMLGSDVLYPEVGRLLAYQNAEILILQAACPTPTFYNKLRSGILARMQENQLFAAASFLAGESPMRRVRNQPYLGRSALLAPQELTPRFNGVLVEMGSPQAEGVVSAEWDFVALRTLWEESDSPIRRSRTGDDVNTLLVALYTQLRALPQPTESELLAISASEAENSAHNDLLGVEDDLRELDDLPIVSSITSSWPLRREPIAPSGIDTYIDTDITTGTESSSNHGQAGTQPVPAEAVEWPPRSYNDAPGGALIRRDDETDEMDAVESERAAETQSGADDEI